MEMEQWALAALLFLVLACSQSLYFKEHYGIKTNQYVLFDGKEFWLLLETKTMWIKAVLNYNNNILL